MQVTIEPGTYVLATSGGVDSMALLHLLRQRSDINLVVAHFDHGIRDDSFLDARLVSEVAESHKLPVVVHRGNLGSSASEAKARKARYDFLTKVKKASGAKAIITAHHSDDVVETAIINLLRGTGRKGLSSLTSSNDMVRPLLKTPKIDIIKYAKQNDVRWREDSTNKNVKYLRNRVRHNIVTLFNDDQKTQFRDIVHQLHKLNKKIDGALVSQLHIQPSTHVIDRKYFIKLPHNVAREFMATWLRARGISSFDKKTLERLVTASKTYKPGKRASVNKKHNLAIGREVLALEPKEC